MFAGTGRPSASKELRFPVPLPAQKSHVTPGILNIEKSPLVTALLVPQQVIPGDPQHGMGGAPVGHLQRLEIKPLGFCRLPQQFPVMTAQITRGWSLVFVDARI